jgi:hypothetical protein
VLFEPVYAAALLLLLLLMLLLSSSEELVEYVELRRDLQCSSQNGKDAKEGGRR